jgi:hypothetical protein
VVGVFPVEVTDPGLYVDFQHNVSRLGFDGEIAAFPRHGQFRLQNEIITEGQPEYP